MTDAEDAHNAELNDLIRACPHEVVRVDKVLRCGKCPARFAVMMFPRRAKPFFMDLDEDPPIGRP